MSFYIAANQRNDLTPILQAIHYPVYLQRLSPTEFLNPVYLLVTSTGLRYSRSASASGSTAVQNTIINETFQALEVGTLGMCSVKTSDISQSTTYVLSSLDIRPTKISFVLLDRQQTAAARQLPYENRITTLKSFTYPKDPSVEYRFLKAMPTQKANDMKRIKTLLQKEQSTGFILTELASTTNVFTQNQEEDDDDDDETRDSENANDDGENESESDDDVIESSSVDRTRFDGRQYLGTDEVDAYIKLMRPHFVSDVSVFPAAYWIALTNNNSRMLDGSDERLMHYMTRPWFQEIGRANVVYVPIVISAHWILATIDFAEHRIKTYDSLVSYHYNKKLVSQNLRQLAHYLKPSSNIDWTFASEPGCVQLDGYNCGIYVLHKIRLSTLNDVPPQFDADEMRQHMGMELRVRMLQPF